MCGFFYQENVWNRPLMTSGDRACKWPAKAPTDASTTRSSREAPTTPQLPAPASRARACPSSIRHSRRRAMPSTRSVCCHVASLHVLLPRMARMAWVRCEYSHAFARGMRDGAIHVGRAPRAGSARTRASSAPRASRGHAGTHRQAGAAHHAAKAMAMPQTHGDVPEESQSPGFERQPRPRDQDPSASALRREHVLAVRRSPGHHAARTHAQRARSPQCRVLQTPGRN